MPHTTVDNFFSGDEMLEWCGRFGFGLTCTTRRDRLPGDIDDKYLHRQKTSTAPVTKVARFLEPVVAVKAVPESGDDKPYVITHTLFQSTSSTNISGVNNLNGCRMKVEPRERGKGENKRRWGIEMNEARQLYLGSYNQVDVWDHMMKIIHLFYISWKYWHAGFLHGDAAVIVSAYSFYCECCEGFLEPTWKKEPIKFKDFLLKLAKQELAYNPANRFYPGEEHFRVSTVKSKKVRTRKKEELDHVTLQQFKDAKCGGKKAHLCGDLTAIEHHFSSFVKGNGRVCAYCGEDGATITCQVCTDKCEKKVCLHGSTSLNPDGKCVFHWHNEMHFGLAREDRLSLLKKKKGEYRKPTTVMTRENARHIKDLKLDLQFGA